MSNIFRSASAALVLMIGLCGCNLLTEDNQLYPGPQRPDNEIVRLSVKRPSLGLSDYDYLVRIEKIYGPVPGRRLPIPPEKGHNFLLLPGSYRVYVLLFTRGNRGEILYSSTVDLSFQADAGGTYLVTYDVLKEDRNLPYLVWIEDVRTKRVVSEKVRFSPKETPFNDESS